MTGKCLKDKYYNKLESRKVFSYQTQEQHFLQVREKRFQCQCTKELSHVLTCSIAHNIQENTESNERLQKTLMSKISAGYMIRVRWKILG